MTATTPQQEAKPPAKGLTELLCEDEFLIRMNCVDMLSQLRHAVMEAASAEEALALLTTTRSISS